MGDRTWYVVTYDIACPRRLVKVHRVLKSSGLAVQKSVFLIKAGQKDIIRQVHGLAEIMDLNEDRVWACPTRGPDYIWTTGRPLSGVELFEARRPPVSPKREKGQAPTKKTSAIYNMNERFKKCIFFWKGKIT